jgi:hypothetical protein
MFTNGAAQSNILFVSGTKIRNRLLKEEFQHN